MGGKIVKKLKIIIPILFIVIIILIVLLNVVRVEEEQKTIKNENDIPNREYKRELVIESNKKRYYGIESIVNKYFVFLNEENQNLGDKITREQYICSILNDDYIQKNNITDENVLEYVRPFGKDKKAYINEMYVRETSDYFVEYVHVILYDREQLDYKNKYNFDYNFNKLDVFYRIDIDSMNSTYDIQPITKQEFEERAIAEDVKITIQKNGYNSISFATNPTDSIMCMKYMDNYKDKIRYDIETAYNLLDKDYREKRFGTIENYKSYVLENKDWLDVVAVDKYQLNYKDGYKEYVCIDRNGNYYIFKETAIMQYTLKLDTYTLESEEFVTQYNKADEQNKVMMNIDKFINMINNKDYKNSYALLSHSFKDNYFKTEEEYKKYIQNNFFEYNEETYTYYEKENNVHSYEIEIKDATGKDSNTITKTIIMKLKEGTDFVMSFNVD